MNEETAVRAPGVNLGLLLFIPYRALENRVLEVLREDGFDDLSLAQARVFQRLHPEGSRITDLAVAAQITKQTAGFLVDGLERAGYVMRAPDPRDARAKLVQITERGRRAVEAAARVVADVEAEWAVHLGARRTAQLREILTDLREITDLRNR
ncbi:MULTISPECIES: MarR family winged helix-turn-helix transcriptional regulator [unclassified Rhodococcus (in: high G+C Gram-positive bacteria)]|jgi:DNA-binding MarR family transcriptional regulator|uniref:MarR family winged helix-turn-helix transcriptional regulator n=1 Tax=unclassified Rhodococcus (in: high G+C Gram-positive bacteria) TaxID=192944 RepID=UPI00146CF90E|nr:MULTISPECIES: MarR family transcriptional regulator [unclassified Rhodococcus (in: high G+C Gram-positive bacteria)]MBF0661496.1 MarR family transcriptional regulator [Rhodococcus sp. (in: high G+C Gram-positive bacteria)]NMD93945.1 MarR family transcriptional regulator [Rhodococcus sp. BL-253-APC-6A1W]NME77826.1 MarR family transcriptional regulator [Rhodococcus sp. 105337]